MKKTYLMTLIAGLLCVLGMKAQVTTEPSPLQEDAQNVVIYFHADQGNKGLEGVQPPTEVYAHTGVITNKSKDNSDWKYAPAWGDNAAKYKMEWVSDNLWKLTIGDLRTYYGVPVGETIEKLAFVFRTADKSKEGKGAGNSDIFVDLVDSGLQIALQASTDMDVFMSNTTVTFTVGTTMASDITLKINDQTVQSSTGATTLTYTYNFNSVGDYMVEATATANGETVSTEHNYLYLGPAAQMAYPGNGGVPVMGPVKNSDGSVTFCFAAPYMTNVVLVGSWNDYIKTSSQQMNYTDYNTINPVYPNDPSYSSVIRYFWTTVSGDLLSDPNEDYLYYFIATGTIPTSNGGSETVLNYVGDPYARLILDPAYDRYITSEVFENLPEYPSQYVTGVPVAVYRETMNEYDWQCTDFELPDKDNLVIYELLLRDFTGTEGQAKGDGTVRQAMERIEYLKTLGVNAIELLPICEFNGNQSWGYNPNFYFAPDKAYGSPEDYKAFIDLCHQNGMAVILDMVFNQSDWLHPWYQMYGGVANSPMYNSKYSGENGAPHAYSVLNDWNQDHPLVQQQWTDVVKYWLTEYNFDGYRFDLVKGLGTNESYSGNGSLDDRTNRYNESRVIEMAYLNSVIQNAKEGAYCINENIAGAQEETQMGNDGELNWAIVNYAGCQFAMGYPEGCDMNRLYAPSDSNRPWGSTVSFLESHDEDRMAWKQNQYGISGVKGVESTSCLRLASAAAIMLMTPGSHMIWQFGELGNAESIVNDRTGNKKLEFNALFNNPDHRAIYNSYAQLNDIRFKNPEFFTKDATFTINCRTSSSSSWPANGFLLFSRVNGKELITAVNPNVTGTLNINYAFQKDSNESYKILTQSYNNESTYNVSTNTISVPANCYVVIGSSDLVESGVEEIGITPENLCVIGGYGEIIVDNASEIAEVYSLDGRVMGKVAGKGSVNVASGLYIVKSGKESVKVVVK